MTPQPGRRLFSRCRRQGRSVSTPTMRLSSGRGLMACTIGRTPTRGLTSGQTESPRRSSNDLTTRSVASSPPESGSFPKPWTATGEAGFPRTHKVSRPASRDTRERIVLYGYFALDTPIFSVYYIRMDIPKQAIEIVTEAERRLRQLVGEAAAGGDYDAVQRITDWARTLGDLVQDAQNVGSKGLAEALKGPAGCMSGPRVKPRELSDSDSAGDTPASSATVPGGKHRLDGKRSRRLKRTPTKGEYPKFFRRGEQFVKIGWSKKERSEYEHKAPRRAVDALTAAISRRSANGKLFTVDDLLPLKDPQDGGELPEYQVYVALAWLRTVGLVEQRGRAGYRVGSPATLGASVREAWEGLVEGR